MKRYLKHKNSQARTQLQEKNDCAVIALSIVMRSTYKEAHQLCASIGRKNRRGTHTRQTFHAIRAAGFKLEPVKRMVQKNGCKYTPKTIGDKLKRGYYLCFCRGHVFAVVNGDVEDWTEGRQHRITSAYKVVRTRAK